MPPRTEDSVAHDFDHRVLSSELEGIIERVHSVITDPMWTVTVHRNQLKLAIDTMAMFTLMVTDTNPSRNPLYRYWPQQRWSVVTVQADQPVLYKHVANMMTLVASWGVRTEFELYGMAKHAAMLIEDASHQTHSVTSGSGVLPTARGDVTFSFPDVLTIVRTDNQAANKRRDA